ncbi:MAG: beta-galactosidase [Clostridia bacterium]|nr:beta-galactosidase [Clostridia bacterium]
MTKKNSYHPPYLGVAYYPEAWPEEEMAKDIAKMKEAGINVARMGEFAWSKMELREGEFHFEWLHRVINALADAGIATILGTPTATPPIWLSRKYPDIMKENETGRRRQHGGRRHCCSNNPHYRAASARIVEAMAKEFGENENVIGWQIDNEIYSAGMGCFCPECQEKFIRELRDRFRSIENLNREWDLSTWSQEYSDFEEIPSPRDTLINPHHKLAWMTFQQESNINFVEMQAKILKQYTKAPLGTDTMPINGTNYRHMTRSLDVAQFNHYNSEENLWEACFWFDFQRTLKDRPFWNTETSPNYSGSIAANGTTRRDGFCYANSFLPLTLGAEANLYWLWRTHFGGHEVMHGSVVYASGRPMYSYREVQKASADFKKAADFLNDTHVETRLALHFPSQSWNFFETQKLSKQFDYKRSVLDCFYRPMVDLGLRPDVIENDLPLDKYQLIFTPFVPDLEQDALNQRLHQWVEQGGIWVVGPMTDIRNRYGAHFHDRPLGSLESFANVYLAHSLPCDNSAFLCQTADGRNLGDSLWYEFYDNVGESLAEVTRSPHSALIGKSVLLRRKIGKGTVIVLGWIPAPQDMKEFLLPLTCDAAGISYGQAEGNCLMVTPRTGNGREGLILAEFEGQGGSYQLPCPMYEHLSGKTLSGRVTIAPYEVLILEKNKT